MIGFGSSFLGAGAFFSIASLSSGIVSNLSLVVSFLSGEVVVLAGLRIGCDSSSSSSPSNKEALGFLVTEDLADGLLASCFFEAKLRGASSSSSSLKRLFLELLEGLAVYYLLGAALEVVRG